DASAVRAAPAASAPGPDGRTAGAGTISKAEAVIRAYLARPDAEPLVRQAFAGVLAAQQRLSDAAEQLRLATEARPAQTQLWLGLGEVELELHHADAAEAALKRALALATGEQAAPAAAAQAASQADDDASDDTGTDDAPDDRGNLAPPADADAANKGSTRPARIRLLLARAAQQRHDDAAAEKWLSEIDPKDADLQVVSLRASLLARRGQLAQALDMIRAAPAPTPGEQRYRLLTEVQLLLDEKKIVDARNVLSRANRETPDDVDLIYQEAMLDERLDKLDDMEILLRRVLVLQPDNSQALNALGYSLADRNLRLDEALGLVKQAHELSPADPFIVDSLGWVEYRMGHFDAATTLLGQAYASRKDTEIAAHLGEALWADGKHDEAARVLRDAHRLDSGNEVLRQTMARLKVAP
ncbi:MAG: tetratricopeptide repeat protein, partial [Burkholderiaceae bacterium]